MRHTFKPGFEVTAKKQNLDEEDQALCIKRSAEAKRKLFGTRS